MFKVYCEVFGSFVGLAVPNYYCQVVMKGNIG